MADLEVKTGVVIPESELSFKATRSSGPGGQNVNKTSSRISLLWKPQDSTGLTKPQKELIGRKLANRISTEGYLIIHAESTRSQFQNKEIAREMLASLVAQALTVPKKRRITKPRPGSIERRIADKIQRGARKVERKKPGDW